MARAKRHYLTGYIWHITYRGHKEEFLLKFVRDQRRRLKNRKCAFWGDRYHATSRKAANYAKVECIRK